MKRLLSLQKSRETARGAFYKALVHWEEKTSKGTFRNMVLADLFVANEDEVPHAPMNLPETAHVQFAVKSYFDGETMLSKSFNNITLWFERDGKTDN